jgi:hypothetical protein
MIEIWLHGTNVTYLLERRYVKLIELIEAKRQII